MFAPSLTAAAIVTPVKLGAGADRARTPLAPRVGLSAAG